MTNNYFEKAKFMLNHNLVNFINGIEKFKMINDGTIYTTDGFSIEFIQVSKVIKLRVYDTVTNKVNENIVANIVELSSVITDYDKYPLRNDLTVVFNKFKEDRMQEFDNKIKSIIKRYGMEWDEGNIYVDSTSSLIMSIEDESEGCINFIIKKEQNVLNAVIKTVNKDSLDSLLSKIDSLIETSELY